MSLDCVNFNSNHGTQMIYRVFIAKERMTRAEATFIGVQPSAGQS